MSKRILICGANGFIGKNLLKRFYRRKGFNIRATYFNTAPDMNFDVEWVKVDLRDKEDVRNSLKDVDIVLQYAAVTSGAKDIIERPHIHIADNAIMNSLLFSEAVASGVEHFVFPSCTIMYQSSDIPVRESDFDESKDVNEKYFAGAHTKVYLEKMCRFYASTGKTKFTVLRQSNIYGPHDKFDLEKGHVFAATIAKVSQSEDFITVWGSGEEERDLLYVEDLADCIELIISKQKDKYQLINVGAGTSVSVSKLVQDIVAASGKNLKIRYDVSKPTIKTKLALDVTRAYDDFGWKPKSSLKFGIHETLKWLREDKYE